MKYSINMQPLTIIIIDKGGELKTIAVKDYKEEELYKKCGFKKAEDFLKQTEWSVKLDGHKYIISMYGKLDGKANMENKYDFPPPVDTKLYFGSCALVGMTKTDTKTFCNLSIPLWNKIYEKLFGGFEDLSSTVIEDEMEVDELESIPKSKKTKKGGYLKDGFVVDTSSSDDEQIDEDDEDDEADEEDEDEEDDEDDETIILEDIGSELSEEEYDYSDDDDKQ